MPTKTRRWNSFSATTPSRSEGKLAYSDRTAKRLAHLVPLPRSAQGRGCGNGAGDYRGGIVYHYLQGDGSVKKIYQTSEGVRAFFGRPDRATFVEDIQTDYKNRRLVTIDLEGKVLSEATMPVHITERLKMEGGTNYELYSDGVCRLQYVNLDQGGTLREVQFACVSSDLTAGFDVKGNALVVGEMLSRESSRALSATVLDLETKQVQKRLKGQWAWSDLTLMKCYKISAALEPRCYCGW